MGDAILYVAMFSASVLSGMLGVGVGFAAVPILGVTGMGLGNGVQPAALLLNGVTALVSAVTFARAGYIDWRQSYRLALVAAIFSPLGAFAAKWVQQSVLWVIYFVAIFGAIYLLVLHHRMRKSQEKPFGTVLLLSVPVSAIGGLLGVGPGILLVPVLIISGFNPRAAAGMTSVAVSASSFVSLARHLGHTGIDVGAVLPLVLVSAAGAYLGGYLSSIRVPEAVLRQTFVVVIIALSAYTGISIGEEKLQQAESYGNCGERTVLVGTRPSNVGYSANEACASLLPRWFSANP